MSGTPQPSYFYPVPEGLADVKKLSAEATYIADLATTVFNFGGLFTYEYQHQCTALSQALTLLQQRITSLASYVPAPVPNFVNDPTVTLVGLTDDFDIIINLSSSTPSTPFRYNQNYIQITGADSAPQSWVGYVLTASLVTGSQTQYVLGMRDQPPDFTAWTSATLSFMY